MKKLSNFLVLMPLASLAVMIAAGCSKSDDSGANPPEPQKPVEQPGAANRGGLGEPSLAPGKK